MLSQCFFTLNTRSRCAVSDRDGGTRGVYEGVSNPSGNKSRLAGIDNPAVLAIAGAVSLNKGYLALLGIGGSVFIGWGAVQSLREIWAQRPVQEEGKAVLAGGFMRGFFTGISNPKDILFLSHFSRSLLPLAAILPPALPRFACCGSCSILLSWRAISLLSNVFSLSRKVDVCRLCGALFIVTGRLWCCTEPYGREIALYVMK